jgi:hypothetical protein
MKKFKFSKSPFWDSVLRNTIFLELSILLIAFIKVIGDGGLKDVTFLNLLYALAITLPCSLLISLVFSLLDKSREK